MDLLRSCYSRDMQFDVAGQVVRNVTWYRCAPGAYYFPGPHAFPSNNWQWQGLDSLGLGERWDSAPKWANGAPLFYAPGNGSYCGSFQQFQQGVPSNATGFPRNGAVPSCCPPAPLTCMPWNEAITPADISCTRVSNGDVWDVYGNYPFGAHFADPRGQSYWFFQPTGETCANYLATVGTFYAVTTPGGAGAVYDGFVVGYDTVSGIATWQIPPASPVYPNEQFLVYRRLH